MKQLGRTAFYFIAIGIAIYAALWIATERLLLSKGHSNPFFKIANAQQQEFDWVVLGASHAMPLDFADFNAFMQRETGLRIINLASPGTGPLYNRFVLEHFLRDHRTRNLLYVVDSFAFASRAWNEDRFADSKLIRATPFEPSVARLLWRYVRSEGVSGRALLDYFTGFSKINNRDRFELDAWEGEAQFDRVYRPSASAVRKRIAYLYPEPPKADVVTRYMRTFSELIRIAQDRGVRVAVVKLPLLQQFRSQLPDEGAFDKVLVQQLTAQGVPLRDLSGELEDPRYYFDTDHLNRAGLSELLRRQLKAMLAPQGS